MLKTAPQLDSLQAGRGVYTAERAAQLSGVPKSTVYYWARESMLVVPSVSSEKVKLWSYRDLIILRFAAWLRTRGITAPDVASVIELVKNSPVDLVIRTGDHRVFGPLDTHESVIDLLNDQTALAGDFAAMLPEFKLRASEVDKLGRRELWGPDLVRPSENTGIDPDVLSGEPFIIGSRIPTASLFALTARSLSPPRIAALYRLDVELVTEALWLERSVKAGKKLPLAA